MQSFTKNKDFACQIKSLHGSSKIVSAKYRWCLTFDAILTAYLRQYIKDRNTNFNFPISQISMLVNQD